MGKARNLIRPRDVQDQRIVLGTTLDLENPGNGCFIQPVGTQTVDGFRGDCHKATLFDDFCRNAGRVLLPGRKIQRLHGYTSLGAVAFFDEKMGCDEATAHIRLSINPPTRKFRRER